MNDTHWIAICDECRRVLSFTSQEERDKWEQSHAEHEETQ